MSQGDPGKDKPRTSRFTPFADAFPQRNEERPTTRPITAEVHNMGKARPTITGEVARTAATTAAQSEEATTAHDILTQRLLALDPRFRQSVFLDFQEDGKPEVPPESAQAALSLVEEAASGERLGQLAASIRRAEYLSSLLGR